MAQKFTGGIGNKLCGECRCPGEGGGRARQPGVPRGRAPCSAPHPRLRSRGYSSRNGRGRGSPGDRGGRLTEVLSPCPCPALLYGDAEKPAESGGSEPPRAASQKAACACNQKPCSCPKAEVNYAFLHATGNGASQRPGSLCPSLRPAPTAKGHQRREPDPGVEVTLRQTAAESSAARKRAGPAPPRVRAPGPASAWHWTPAPLLRELFLQRRPRGCWWPRRPRAGARGGFLGPLRPRVGLGFQVRSAETF